MVNVRVGDECLPAVRGVLDGVDDDLVLEGQDLAVEEITEVG